jgi:hypothetical protein
MFGLLGVVSIAFTIAQLVKENRDKHRHIPPNHRFDYEAHWEDIRNGMSLEARMEKDRRGGYYTTKPEPVPWYKLPPDTVVDTARYERDKKELGEGVTELQRRAGHYRYIK